MQLQYNTNVAAAFQKRETNRETTNFHFLKSRPIENVFLTRCSPYCFIVSISRLKHVSTRKMARYDVF